MKTLVSSFIALVANFFNIVAMSIIVSLILASELMNLSHFHEMVMPGTNWFYNNPETILFAFSAPKMLLIEFLLTAISTVLTLLYVKMKKNRMVNDNYDTFSSKTAIFTFCNILSWISLAITSVLSIFFYLWIPMSIVYIIMTCVFIYFMSMREIISNKL